MDFLFKYLSENELIEVQKKTTQLTYKRNEVIFKQGLKTTHVAFLQKGIVKFVFEKEQNKNIILSVASAPKIIGGSNLFNNEKNLFSILAVDDCDVLLVEASAIWGLLKKNGILSVDIYRIVSEMYNKSIINFISLACKQKEGRIADIVLLLSNEVFYNNTFPLLLNRKEISEFACCSVENVIMTLSKWKKEKIIEISNKTITILDIEKLMLISKIS